MKLSRLVRCLRKRTRPDSDRCVGIGMHAVSCDRALALLPPEFFFRAPFVHLPFTKARKVRASHPPLVPRQRLTRRKSDDRALHSRPNWSFVSIRGVTTNCSGQAEGQAQALVYTRSHRYMRDGCFRAWAPCFDLFLFSRLPACGRKIGPRPDSDFRACLRAREHGPRTGRLCRRGARITGETGRATGPDFRGVE